MVPAAVMAVVVLRILFDVLRDPTSHNLFPFELPLAGSLSAGFMILLFAARKLLGARP